MTDSDETQSSILRALADENRIRLLRVLFREVLNVQELCEILDLPQSRVSRHLAILRGTGLVHDQREGSRVYYSMSKLDGDFELISGYIDGLSRRPHRDLERMDAVLSRRTRESQDFAVRQAGCWDELGSMLHSSPAVLLAMSQLMRNDHLVLADLGTGTGLLLPLLSSSVGKLFAVDHAEEMLALAQKRCVEQAVGNVEFFCCGLNDLTHVLPQPCDCMLMHFVLHQLARPGHTIKDVVPGLVPGGRLVVVDRVKHEDEDARRRFGSLWLGFERDSVTDWFSDAGLSNVVYHELSTEIGGRPTSIFVAAGTR